MANKKSPRTKPRPKPPGSDRMVVRCLLDLTKMVSLQIEERVGRLRLKGTFKSTMVYNATPERVRAAVVAAVGVPETGVAEASTRSVYVTICSAYGVIEQRGEPLVGNIRLRYAGGSADLVFKKAIEAIAEA